MKHSRHNRAWSKSAATPRAHLAESTITLIEPFYKEIDERRIPVERQTVAALTRPSAVLPTFIADVFAEEQDTAQRWREKVENSRTLCLQKK